jgi:hypothetical protein
LRVLKSRKQMTIVRRRNRTAAWSDVIVDRRRSATGRACVKTRTSRSAEQFNFLQAPIDRGIPGTGA